ncbi:MAG: DUF2067 domain-containing protein [Thermoproteus sp.]
MYRTISIKFSNSEETQYFLEILPKYINIDYYAIVRGSNVYIQLSGSPLEIKRALASIKTATGLVRSKLRPIKSYPLDILFKEVDVSSPIPPDVLADYLSAAGFKARLKELNIQTDAPLGQVRKAVSELSNAYKALEDLPISPQAKRVVAVYMAVAKTGPREALERLVAAGLLNKGVVFSLSTDLRTAKRRLKALLDKR